MKRKLYCNSILFLLGGGSYGLIELLWRRYTHWSMLVTGGICFLILYRLFTKIALWPVYTKCIIGSVVITLIEFTSGVIFNILLKMKVWDYSSLPGNFMGQICIFYSFLWGLLSIPITALCKYIHRRFKW